MTRHLVVFIITFAIGAVVAVILRTGSHKPYDEHRGHPAPSAASAAPATAYEATESHVGHTALAQTTDAKTEHDHAAMPAPTADAKTEHDHAPMPAPAVDEHADHDHHAPAEMAVNTICAICGMPVDPKHGTIAYKGKLIGFGCKTCPPKFRADPDKYGEAALKNQVVE